MPRTFVVWFLRTALITIALTGVVVTVQIDEKGWASLLSHPFLARMMGLGLLGLVGCALMGLAQVAFEKQGGIERDIFEDVSLFACLEGTIFSLWLGDFVFAGIAVAAALVVLANSQSRG